MCLLFFFFNDTATTEIYTLSLHDALPISSRTSEAALWPSTYISPLSNSTPCIRKDRISSKSSMRLRSEERFSRNAETDLVCRLLLEKKKKKIKQQKKIKYYRIYKQSIQHI